VGLTIDGQSISVPKGTLVVEASCATVAQALAQVASRWPAVTDRVLTEQGELRRHVNVLVGEESIRDYLATGRGRIVHRGSARLEEDQRGRRLIITEVPFVGRANVKTSIAKAFNDGKLPGLIFEGHIPDESSDQNGTRIVLPLRKEDAPAEVVAGLYQHTHPLARLGAN